MRRDILRQFTIDFLYIARHIQIARILFQNIRVLHKASITLDGFSADKGLYDFLNILFTESVLVAILLESAACVNQEDAIPGFRILFVDDNNAGGDTRSVKQVCR